MAEKRKKSRLFRSVLVGWLGDRICVFVEHRGWWGVGVLCILVGVARAVYARAPTHPPTQPRTR